MKLPAKLNYFVALIGKGLKAKGSITEPGGVWEFLDFEIQKSQEIHFFIWISIDFDFQWISQISTDFCGISSWIMALVFLDLWISEDF